MKWKVLYKRKGEKHLLAGDSFILEASSEKDALKKAGKMFKDGHLGYRPDLKGIRFVYAIEIPR